MMHADSECTSINPYKVRESDRDIYSKRRIIVVTELQIVEWHSYKHLDWITLRRDDEKLYKFKEGDFKRLCIQDIKDMLLLLMQRDPIILRITLRQWSSGLSSAFYSYRHLPVKGWAVIRFVADNPGTWIMHCHLDVHIGWGLAMVFVVEDGPGQGQKLEQPPPDLPMICRIMRNKWCFYRDDIMEVVLREATRTGAAPNVSDAYTINGQPGDLYNCSSKDTVIVPVVSGETNLLRVINAALNQQLFVTIANHKLTVVGADASYVKPFTTKVLMLGPGQTSDVLIKADQSPGRYYIAARAYASAQGAPFDNTTTTAILEYNTAKGSTSTPIMPSLPAFNDTATATAFTTSFRSIEKALVPTDIDHNLFITAGLGINQCPPKTRARNCQAPNGTRFTASMNNVSFVLPSYFSLLQAYHQGIPGVFTTDFPAKPPAVFDYTGNVSRSLWQPLRGTKVYKLKYGSKVQIVLQGTSIFTAENHPIHLHGYDFYILAEGFGNFNPKTDTSKFNLVDPPLRNTVSLCCPNNRSIYKLQRADASYVKPFTTKVLMLGPGQTTDVLIKADQSQGRYYIAARAYASAQGAPFDNTTTTAILEYNTAKGSTSKPIMPSLPAFNDTATATAFTTSFRSLEKALVPTDIDHNLFITAGLGINQCPPKTRARNCQAPNGTRFTASMNNVSFVLPSNLSLLQAYHQGISGVFTSDFPAKPPVVFDYTGNVSRSLWQPIRGTKVYKLKYGSKVQIVLQGTSIFTAENHPIHLHGYDFYILAEGFGNFNPKTDTSKFNLVDPPLRNTVSLPVKGWAVIRFVADNPGKQLEHGVRQMTTAWADGPEFITQCPIRPGASYTYRFTISGQEGTLWWHAHSSWLRATVYGSIIIHPREGYSYPFPKPKREAVIALGEWWDANPIDVIREATRTGAAPNVSDAYTINGQPGDLYNCSSKDTVIVPVVSGETNLLRVINAALNQQLFVTIANHKLTVVGADASYVKPFTTKVLMLGPGQTTDVLIKADQSPGRYYIAARAYASAQGAPFDNTTTTAILEYNTAKGSTSKPIMPPLPAFNDTATATAFTTSFRSLEKAIVPTEIDHNLFITAGLGINQCPPKTRARNCQAPNGTRFTANMNNVSFVLPSNVSILQAYHQGIPGVFTTDFPAKPPSTILIVLQGTSIFTAENHPIHLHGYDFYILAEGFGNFNPKTDTSKFNLVDPSLRNTVSLPVKGWAVIRFVADNPGTWIMHCHLDVHIGWGLAMVFVVEDGPGPGQKLEQPPPDLPVDLLFIPCPAQERGRLEGMRSETLT
nr:laccase-12-like [Tanacetum cinerariifolium]